METGLSMPNVVLLIPIADSYHFGANREIRFFDTIIGQIITDGEWNYHSTFGGYYY